ncbi:MAG: RNA polymerase sigma factor [Chloroflexi bacterium]|nr:RNA polymerase sigma factor [Chloroflexota bacterium]
MSPFRRGEPGDIEGFEALYERHKGMVFRTAMGMVGDENEAQDILQATFIRVYESRHRLDGDEEAFKRWLYRVTVNLSIDVYRKRKRTATLSLDHAKSKGFEPEAESTHSKLEARDLVWKALDCLDGKHRSVVVLKYFHGLAYDEIARTLNIPLGTVRSRLNAATRAMSNKLSDERREEVSDAL